jgi:hypothetical protein
MAIHCGGAPKDRRHSMRRNRWFLMVAVLVMVGLLAAAVAAGAQTGGGYDLTWNTLDGGGGTSSGGAYTLMGTAGQPDAGGLSGGSYSLQGGFWAGVAEALPRLFLPLIVG